MRIVLRIGGSVLTSPLNPVLLARYINLLKKLRKKGHEIAVVVGGGKLARDFIFVTRELGLDEQFQDEIAIAISRILAQLLFKALGDIGSGGVPLTLGDVLDYLEKGRIPVMGGLRPGMTTDTVAALLAEKWKAELMIKGTDQDGVYDKDPRKYRDAVKLDRLSYKNLPFVFSEKKHKAGIHQIIDPEAAKILKRIKLRLIVVNGFEPENVLAAVNGDSIGTLIS